VDVDCCYVGIECYISSERRVMRYICESCRMLCVKIRKFDVVVIGGKRKEICRECYEKLIERNKDVWYKER